MERRDFVGGMGVLAGAAMLPGRALAAPPGKGRGIMTAEDRLIAIEQISMLKARYFRFADTKDWEELPGDRKSVVEGKGVSVRVDLGGRRILQHKTRETNTPT